MSIWTESTFNEQEWRSWHIGPLTLWGRNIDDEYHITTDLIDEEEIDTHQSSAKPNEDAEIRRWILKREPLAIRLKPVMPDRPVVVRPESPIRFPKGRKARIYVSIPIWVQVIAKQSDETVLSEESTRKLSNIWFGEPMNGVLAYSLKIRARRDLTSVIASMHRAICPVTITNVSEEELDFQRLCIHVEHLAIYGEAEKLWTNEVHVRFRGQNDVSRVIYGEGPPLESEEALKLSDARKPAKQSKLRKSFLNLARITGLYGGE